MYHINVIREYIRLSALNELAYPANFYIRLLHGLLNFGTGFLGIYILFGQIDTVQGWDFDSTVVLLGVYLIVSAMRGLFISPSLDSLAGMNGDIWNGRFDFTLLRPLNPQFQVSFQRWQPLMLFDLLLGAGTLIFGIVRLGARLGAAELIGFVFALLVGLLILYAILLFFAALTVWSPGFLFTWVFNDIFQMARYPLGLYPGWIRFLLTWIIPVGLITTIPAQTLTGEISPWLLLGSGVFASALFAGATLFFRYAIRHYASASS